MRSTRWFQTLLRGTTALGLLALGLLLSCSGGGGNPPTPPTPTPAPTILSISPASGSVGTTVTITGTSLDTVTAVNFGSTAAVIGTRTATQLATTVPSGASTGTISVTGPGGTAVSTTTFTVPINQAPGNVQIAGPTSLVVGHPALYNLSATDPENDAITFSSSTPGAATPVSTGAKTATMSFAGQTSGTPNTQTLSVIATDSHGAASSPATFAVSVIDNRAPQFTSQANVQFTNPTVGAPASYAYTAAATDPDNDAIVYTLKTGSVQVSLDAAPFAAADSTVTVTAGGTFSVSSTVPVSMAGKRVQFTVTATDQLPGFTSSQKSTDYTVTMTIFAALSGPAPTLTSFAPPTGPVGTSVILTGTNFTGATSVSFHGTASTFTVNSATQISATVPGGATTGTITVTTPGGSAPSSTNFTVTTTGSAPTLSGFSVASALPGQAVQIMGSNLIGADSLTFNGTAALFVEDSASQLTAIIPLAATSGSVAVHTAGGAAASPSAFTVLPYPTAQVSNSTITPIPDATTSADGPTVLIPFNVSGLTQPIKDVAISFYITHTYDGDLDLQLVAPDNTAIPLVGSRNDAGHNYGTACGVANETTFSDSGAGSLSGGAPYVGVYKPAVAFSTLAGKTGNGTWNLRIVDTGHLDVGTFLCGTLVVTGGPQPPTLTRFNPTTAPNPATVILAGTHLIGASSATIGSFNATILNDSDTELILTVPAGATAAPIRVVTPGGTAITSTKFTPTSSGPTADLFIDGAYVVQSAQNYVGGVPLVAGKDAVLRVFARGNQPGITAPSVRVRMYNGTSLTSTHTLPSAFLTTVPTIISEASLTQSWNLSIPGASVQPGLGLLIDVDPTNGITEADETNNTWPASGTPMALDVHSLQTFHGTLIPITQSSLTGNANAGNLASWYAKLQKMYPVAPGMDLLLGAPYTTAQVLVSAGGGWSTLLSELEAKRVVEASTRYYYGALNVSYPSGVAGLGYVPPAGSAAPRSAMGWDKTTGYADGGLYYDVLTHETGHNMGRAHSPCGGAAGPDPGYPYAGAKIGIYGLDVAAMSIKDPNVYTDIMAYCTPVWISDYVYTSILNFRQVSPYGIAPPQDSATPTDSNSLQDCLLVMGRVHNGQVELEPALQARTIPTPDGVKSFHGQRLIEGRDARGEVLFRRVLPLAQVADDIPGSDDQHFIAAIPMKGIASNALHELRVVGDSGTEAVRWSSNAPSLRSGTVQAPQAFIAGEGEVRLTWDSALHPLVMVRDANTGDVLSFARGGDMLLKTKAKQLELTLSDGVAVERTTLKLAE